MKVNLTGGLRRILQVVTTAFADLTTSQTMGPGGEGGGGDNLHFFYMERVHRGLILETILSIFTIYFLFRSQKHASVKLLFHVQRRSARGAVRASGTPLVG